ncbi:MAG: right-handed parallel beta-helix repeat-containing protein [Candidatus Hodarchaeales archaeon]|jgi:parallel beta-helix repeat protein
MKNFQIAIMILITFNLLPPIRLAHIQESPNLLTSKMQYTPHTPITIDGNEDFSALAQGESWEGDGSSGNPFIIEELSIIGVSDKFIIDICNTDVYFEISNCYLTQGTIRLFGVTNGRLTQNSVIDTEIILQGSENNILSSNIVTNTKIFPGDTVIRSIVNPYVFIIQLSASQHNILDQNTITNNKGGGIHVLGSGNCTLINNNVSNTFGEGILIENSGNNRIKNNVLHNSGFWLISSSCPEEIVHYLQVEVTNNSINGKPLIYWQQVTGGIISNELAELVYIINCNSVEITNQDIAEIIVVFSHFTYIHSNTIRNGRIGIYLESCSDTLVEENTITSNTESGICITYSGGSNQIIMNILNNNSQGIDLDNIQNAQITNNTVNGGGINLRESSGNHLINNSLSGEGLFMEGYNATHYSQSEVLNNNVNGKPLIYWHQITGGTVPSGAGQVILVECSLVQVIGQEMGSMIGVYCSQLTIQNNMIGDSRFGIFLSRSNSNVISENVVTNSTGNGIYLEFAENSLLTSNTITHNNGKGIYLYIAPNSELSDNIVAHNKEEGISLGDSGESKITSNFVLHNKGRGIYIGVSDGGSPSPSTTATGNTVTNNSIGGIYLDHSADCTISDNVIQNNGIIGISIDRSGNNVIKNNILEENCVYLSSYRIEDYTQLDMTNNSIDGLPLLYWQHQVGIKVPKEARQVILVECTLIDISNLMVVGILGVNCTNLSIKYNRAYNGYNGITLIETDFSEISSNDIFDMGGEGIYIEGSENNFISNNAVTRVKRDGILLRGTWGKEDKNSLLNNSVHYNGGRGIAVGEWEPCSQCAGHAYITDYTSVINNTISNNNGTGLSIVSEYSEFYRNIITNNLGMGIHLRASSNCTLIGNVIASNSDYGIYTNSVGVFLDYWIGTNNSFYYNDFLNNRISAGSQACDNEFDNLFSHNHWDDWTEPDENNDGIVDLPYLIDGITKNQDIYPLVSPINNLQFHYLFSPRIIYPNGREIISESTRITWIPAYDILFHTIKYSVYYSPDGGNTWNLIIEQFTGNEVAWNVKGLASGSFYMVKVIAICSNGSSAVDISNEPFSITDSESSLTTSSHDRRTWSFSFLITLMIMILITLNGKKRLRKF